MPHAPHCDRPAGDMAYDLASTIRDKCHAEFQIKGLEARIQLLADQLRPLVDQSPTGDLRFTASIQGEVYDVCLKIIDEFGITQVNYTRSVHYYDLDWPDVPSGDAPAQIIPADAACDVEPALVVIDQEAS